MSQSYFEKQETTISLEGISSIKIKDAIGRLTDEDFNGNNGEEYYTEIEIDGKKISMSKLDAAWLQETAGKSEEQIIYDACYIIESI